MQEFCKNMSKLPTAIPQTALAIESKRHLNSHKNNCQKLIENVCKVATGWSSFQFNVKTKTKVVTTNLNENFMQIASSVGKW